MIDTTGWYWDGCHMAARCSVVSVIEDPPVGYGPLYPSVWIKEEPGRGWAVTFAFDAVRQIRHVIEGLDQAQRLAETWRRDIALGRQPSTFSPAGEARPAV